MNQDPELKIELTINEKNIEMNEFVHKIVGHLLWAVLKSLRLNEEPKTATFKLNVK